MRAERTSSGIGQGDLLRGLAAGLVGGLLASAVMNAFQSAVTPLLERAQGGSDEDSPEPATVQAAEAVSVDLLGHHLAKDEKEPAGAAVHYAAGMALGGLYGVAAVLDPRVTAGAGLPYGAAVAAVLDEAIVPVAGLSGPPWQSPVLTHVYWLASHLVFGLTLEVARRGVISVLAPSEHPRGRR